MSVSYRFVKKKQNKGKINNVYSRVAYILNTFIFFPSSSSTEIYCFCCKCVGYDCFPLHQRVWKGEDNNFQLFRPIFSWPSDSKAFITKRKKDTLYTKVNICQTFVCVVYSALFYSVPYLIKMGIQLSMKQLSHMPSCHL